MESLTPATFAKAFACLVLGVVAGAVGTIEHRAAQPWGLVVSIAFVLCAGVLARAWGGLVPLVGYAGGVFLAVTAMSQTGPGGDVLVPSTDSLGWWWVGGVVVALVLAFVAPARWFSDTRRARPQSTRA